MSAVDEIVSNRLLQSVDFEHGKSLTLLITGGIKTATLSPNLVLTWIGDGLFITGTEVPNDARFFVIDIEQSAMFTGLTETEALMAFQKSVRFAKKLWQGMSFTFSELMISGSTKAVLFPFRAYRPTPYKLVIEREPMADRLSKRGHAGRFLLLYKSGQEQGDAKREEAGLTNFRKAYDAVNDVRKMVREAHTPAERSAGTEQLQVTELREDGFSGSLYRRYEDWLPLLTTQQLKFVQAGISGPVRIEGAAGTGKTLCLMLKAVHALRFAKQEGWASHVVFITHSDATKRAVHEVLSVMDSDGFVDADRTLSLHSLKVCTLSELCAEHLRQSISESEFIDRDAMESKELQLLYISEALERTNRDDLSAHSRFLSAEFLEFLRTEDSWKIVEMLQHEFSVLIKGRAAENFDNYKKAKSITYGLPVINDADKGYVFTIFRAYQQQLGDAGQFDTDDVVLTTIGQLDTPIWRRRRLRDGYDGVFIDETHLFNINELHLFHYFTRSEGPYPIIYSVDRSQAVGDRGWTSQEISETLEGHAAGGGIARQKVNTVFRSSPDIVNLSFSILTSGATLFTNFDNPMEAASSGFTEEDERLACPPVYIEVPNEAALIEEAFDRAEALHRDMECRRSDILLVALDPVIVAQLHSYATERNKAVVLLKRRGDLQAVEAARQSGQLVIGHADYVGGLEFAAVVLVGIDAGRVPPSGIDKNESSKNFLLYAAHNRLYVAVSRAKYRVEIMGEKARGPSRLIVPAMEAGLLQRSGETLGN
ncbi:MAG TPA: UvrD-helicase domain-containing protein [Allosphingosinicella sp.]|nr:UvrD-helicase domain-containing protein [Allosphingosinicella sp.]